MHLPIHPGYEHIAGPKGSSVDNLCCVHMAERRAGEEDWHTETKQVYDLEAWAVKGKFLIQVNVAFGTNSGLELSQTHSLWLSLSKTRHSSVLMAIF